MEPFTGSDLRAFRKRFRAKQVDMAKAFGVEPLTWLRWEKRAEVPVVVRLALSAWVHQLAPWGAEEERK